MRPWSYSRLTCWEECPKRYWYRYVEKMPSKKVESPAASRGSDIHEKAEMYLKGMTPMYPPELQKVSAHAMLLKGKKAQAEVQLGVKSDWSPCDYDDPETYNRAIIDVLYVDGDTVHIEDWKTGQIYPSHKDQLKTYVAIVAAHHPDKALKSRPIYVDQGIVASPDQVLPERVHGIRLLVDGRIQQAESDTIFPVRSGPGCKWCDFSSRHNGPCPN